MAIDYDRINFQNLPNTTTPISAENLNLMDEAIYDLVQADLSEGGTVTGNLNIKGISGINNVSTTTSETKSLLQLGNNTAVGSVGNSTGRIVMYGDKTSAIVLEPSSNMSSGNKSINFPDKTGTLVVDTDFVVNTATPNTSYMNSNQKISWSQVGKMVIGSGRITTTSQKPSGQANYLFKDLPPALTTAPVNCQNESLLMIVNQDGYLTSNIAIPANTYNITFSYLTV